MKTTVMFKREEEKLNCSFSVDIIKPQSSEHRLDTRNKTWLSKRLISMYFYDLPNAHGSELASTKMGLFLLSNKQTSYPLMS